MANWQKYTGMSVILFLVCFISLTCTQSFQYIAALTGAGFAKPLPVSRQLNENVSCNPLPLNVMSFNVRYGSSFIESMSKRFSIGDMSGDYLSWSARIPEIRARIAEYAPDLLGLQEMDSDADINAIAPSDKYSLVSYHLGGFQYGDAALLYKTDRFEQMDSGQIWLGSNPELPMSFGFHPLSMIRYINWALLRDKSSGFKFIFVNTHFDNYSKNKDQSAVLFREKMSSLTKDFPVVVTGDFNTKAKDTNYQRFTGADQHPQVLKNVFLLAKQRVDGQQMHPSHLIDHILVGGACHVEADKWLVDARPLKNGKSMSDHNLLFAKLRFSSKPIGLAVASGLN